MSMDKLLALEMTWLRGTAMVQTLFTCLYCQRPAAIQNKTLQVYCRGVLKTCEVSKRAASRASVYEVRPLVMILLLCEHLPNDGARSTLTARTCSSTCSILLILLAPLCCSGAVLVCLACFCLSMKIRLFSGGRPEHQYRGVRAV